MDSEVEIEHGQAVEESLIGSTTDYVYTVKMDHGRPVATFHSTGCQAITGYTAREFETDPSLWYRMIHEADRPAVLAQVDLT